MKLYATVTSERASKGQGGNKKLEIDINVVDRTQASYRCTTRHMDDGRFLTQFEVYYFGTWRIVYEDSIWTNQEETKGNKQKGETRHDDRDYNINPCTCGADDCPSK